MARPQTEMVDVAFDRVFKQVLSVESAGVVTDCFVTISKLVQMQIKLLPLVPPNFSQEGRESYVILQQVKSSVRTLSEDVWSVFQTITNLMKYEDWTENQTFNDLHDSLGRKTNPHLATLCLQLKALETRLTVQPQARSNGEKLTETVRGSMRLGKDPTEGFNMISNLAELNIKVSDAYEAAVDLGAYTGKDCPLRCLSKVLSELDALLALMENDFGSSKKLLPAGNKNVWTENQLSCIKANNPNRPTVEMQSGKGDKKPTDETCCEKVAGAVNNEVSRDTGTSKEPVREKPNERLIQRSKYSDTLVRSTIDGVEVFQVESVPDRKRRSSKKKKSAKSKASNMSCGNSDTSTISDDSLHHQSTTSLYEKDSIQELTQAAEDSPLRETSCTESSQRGVISKQTEESTTSVYETDSIQELVQAADGTRLETVPTNPVQQTSSTDSSQSNHREFFSLNGSQSNTETFSRDEQILDNVSQDVKMVLELDRRTSLTDLYSVSRDEQVLDNVSQEVDMVLELDRRTSLTDLYSGVDERVVPHPSVAQWDMIPTTTTSCPAIAGSDTLKKWSGHAICNQTSRQKRLTSLLFCSLSMTFFMAVLHITANLAGLPITDYLRELVTEYLTLLREDVGQRVQHIQSLITLDKLFDLKS